jgi:hypothetical protein
MTRFEPAVLSSRLDADVWRAVGQRAYRAGSSTSLLLPRLVAFIVAAAALVQRRPRPVDAHP